MNCQPGDIAIAIGESRYKGHLFEVLYLAPPDEFALPDGQVAEAPGVHPSWVVRSLCGGVIARLLNGSTRLAQYGVASDSKLRPLRGLPDDAEAEKDREHA